MPAVTARKVHRCRLCDLLIPKGGVHLSDAVFNLGDPPSRYRRHKACDEVFDTIAGQYAEEVMGCPIVDMGEEERASVAVSDENKEEWARICSQLEK